MILCMHGSNVLWVFYFEEYSTEYKNALIGNINFSIAVLYKYDDWSI